MKLGKDLVLAIGGTPLAACRSCNIDKQQSFIPTASPTSGRWEQSTPERLAWSISADCLLGTMAAYKTLDAAQDAGTELTIRYYDTDYNLNKTGTAYIESLRLEGSVGSLCKMSVTLKGSGSLTTYGGVVINPTVDIAYQDAFYSLRDGKAFYTQSEGAECKLLTLEADKPMRISVNPGGYVVMVTHDASIYQPFFNQDDFSPAYYGCTVFTYPGEILLQPGTNYLIYTTSDDGADAPIIKNLS